MNCPKCGQKTTVVDIATATEEVYRKRKCQFCGHKICTIEYEVECDQRFKNEWAQHNRAWTRNRKTSKSED